MNGQAVDRQVDFSGKIRALDGWSSLEARFDGTAGVT